MDEQCGVLFLNPRNLHGQIKGRVNRETVFLWLLAKQSFKCNYSSLSAQSLFFQQQKQTLNIHFDIWNKVTSQIWLDGPWGKWNLVSAVVNTGITGFQKAGRMSSAAWMNWPFAIGEKNKNKASCCRASVMTVCLFHKIQGVISTFSMMWKAK